MHDHHHRDDHDDFGGLHRDLLATGAAMDRRGLLRLAARFGVGAGALQLLGCGSEQPDLARRRPPDDDTTSGGTTGSTCSADPAGDAGPTRATARTARTCSA